VVIFLPVAPDDLPRVRAVLDGTLAPVEPRRAVTVVLVRDGAEGLEVLLLRRNPQLAFAPGRYVYPGGSLEASDAEPVRWVGAPPDDPALVVAAVRETFEECGVLLAVDADESTVGVEASDATWEEDRVALETGATSLAAVLERRTLALDAGLVRPLAHWVTPIAEKRRFDTRFLLAALPEGQEAWEIVGEADLHVWLRPGEALLGDRPMMPPTRAVLRALRKEPSVADALARPRVVERIEPGVRLVGDRVELLLP